MTLAAALAGRRIDAADSKKSRFPLANVSLVRDRLRELFIKRGVDTLVCSAACGADLVALEVAEHLRVRCRIVLPLQLRDSERPPSAIDRETGGRSLIEPLRQCKGREISSSWTIRATRPQPIRLRTSES
jgi:hypothetical protein